MSKRSDMDLNLGVADYAFRVPPTIYDVRVLEPSDGLASSKKFPANVRYSVIKTNYRDERTP